MPGLTRRDCFKTGLSSLAARGLPGLNSAHATEFSFHRDHVLGTSFDGCLLASSQAAADAAEAAALDEIERLRMVFSLFDPASELCRLNRALGSVALSADMLAVLAEYEIWQNRSGGACNAQMGRLTELWTEAERLGRSPDPALLAATVRGISGRKWNVNQPAGQIRRECYLPFNLNSAAKGYILGRAMARARDVAHALSGGLLNLGGDIVCWGNSAWPVAIQDPRQPWENARPLGVVSIRNEAVATSGGYQRGYTIGRQRFSHLLDPRSGRPADQIASATVKASSSTTANILATTLCVLTPGAGLSLVQSVPGAECLIVAATGEVLKSPGLELGMLSDPGNGKKFELVGALEKKDKEDPWPEDFQVAVAVEIPKVENARKYRRPYVAIWIEDSAGKPIRTLSVWGNAPRWIGELTDWWKIGKGNTELVKATTRATRGPGKYEVVWDGKNDKGVALPQGVYTVRIEVHREHGKHVRQTGKIECKATGAKLTLEKNAEAGITLVEYRKKQS